MSKGTISKLSRKVLLFLGGVALGYSIRVLTEDKSFEEVKYSIFDIIHKFGNDSKDYIDVDVEVRE